MGKIVEIRMKVKSPEDIMLDFRQASAFKTIMMIIRDKITAFWLGTVCRQDEALYVYLLQQVSEEMVVTESNDKWGT